jgi:hypothetical protein
MHTNKVRHAAAAAARLERLIDALALELVEASDEEVLQACADLGMKPEMRGSAAFIGLKGVSVSNWRLEDFFDLKVLQRMQLALAARRTAVPGGPNAGTGRPCRGNSIAAEATKAGNDDDADDQ